MLNTRLIVACVSFEPSTLHLLETLRLILAHLSPIPDDRLSSFVLGRSVLHEPFYRLAAYKGSSKSRAWLSRGSSPPLRADAGIRTVSVQLPGVYGIRELEV